MKTRHCLSACAILLFALVIFHTSSGAVVKTFTEDFSTKQYCDTLNTTALWDTVAGELRLPLFELTLAGSYDTPDRAYGVAIAGDYAYVADGYSGLQVIDISDPTAPSYAGSYLTWQWCRGVAISGNYAYVADYSSGLHVIDISDPTAPSYAGSYDTPGNALGVAISGDYAYVADESTFQVIDISAPTAPSYAGSYDTPNFALGVAISGDYAYVAYSVAGLQVIDISDPTAPSPAGSYDTPDRAHGVAIVGDFAYVADAASGLQVLDISDPTGPSFEGSYDTPGYAYGVAIAGDYAYVADAASGLQVLDISDPAPPTLVGSYDTPDAALRVVVDGDYAYVADRNWSFQIVDVSDPSAPTLAGSADYYANGVAVAGNYAYLAGHYYTRFYVVDISDPTNPTQVSSTQLGRPWDVAVAGDHAYVANHEYGLRVLDISDPTAPSQAGNLSTPSDALRIALAGDYAYIAEYAAGLHVIDIGDPTNPSSAGSYDTPGNAAGIAIAGDYAFVADEGSGLQIIDISDPSIPVLAGSYDTPGEASDVAVTGDYAFVADALSGLQIIDITDPTNPVLIESYDTPGRAHGVTHAGDHVFVADDASGLQVIQVFQRLLNIDDNVGQAVAINSSTEDVLGVKLSSSQTDSVRWEISADDGSNWQEVPLDGSWNIVSVPGSDLLWRSAHVYTEMGVNPTCTSVTIEWLNGHAPIEHISDVPNDQGRQARISWYRSGHDYTGSPTPITEYAIFRKIDHDLSLSAMGRGWGEISSSEPPVPELAYPPGDWDFLMSVPADCEDAYWAVVPTLADSTIAEGMYYTTFFVRARTATPGAYYDSPPDSGYSVDNLAPSIPASIQVAYNTGGGNQLTWQECPDADFDYFCVYRGESADFVPDPGNLEQVTLGTDWLDTVEDGWKYHYKITAVDFSGNESDPTGAGTVTGTDTPETPRSFALYQNVPNPFNPTTAIVFDVPNRARVKLVIYDVSGRLVRNLVDRDMEPGRKSVAWDGRDFSGGNVASGIYFYRLETPTFSESKKMILLR